eukprot:TRINITY_DN1178_c0_g1_i1.p1 TRINITY_DN1178_c0_g1~~TRINITY_DN1178_c0_g1_i1.p1  ORF type:complete len:173 (+),score=55.25 TRINITY_DN1178_c0_g1_i1:102-620(+)
MYEFDEEVVQDEVDIDQEQSWYVISAFFEVKGLVRQQLDSFDEFIQSSIQEIVDENSSITLWTEYNNYTLPRYKISFKQIYLSKPTISTTDGAPAPMFPKEARLRNLTYTSPLYVDMTKSTMTGPEGDEIETAEAFLETVFIGNVPFMVKTQFLPLLHDADTTNQGKSLGVT